MIYYNTSDYSHDHMSAQGSHKKLIMKFPDFADQDYLRSPKQ